MAFTFFHPLIFNMIYIATFTQDTRRTYLDSLSQHYQTSRVLRQVPTTPIQQHFSSSVFVSSSHSNPSSPISLSSPQTFLLWVWSIPTKNRVQNGFHTTGGIKWICPPLRNSAIEGLNWDPLRSVTNLAGGYIQVIYDNSQERSSRGPPFAFRLDLGHSVSSGPYQWWAESLSCGCLRSWIQKNSR